MRSAQRFELFEFAIAPVSNSTPLLLASSRDESAKACEVGGALARNVALGREQLFVVGPVGRRASECMLGGHALEKVREGLACQP